MQKPFTLKGITMLVIALMSFSLISCSGTEEEAEETKIKALIIDGQSNHGIWPKTTAMMKDYLEKTGLFTVDVARTKYLWLGPHSQMDSTQLMENYLQYTLDDKEYFPLSKPQMDSTFSPDFSQYDLVISNFGWLAAELPEQTKRNLEEFVANGGGFIVTHAANNSWEKWEEFNKMIGLGGWGGRNEESGPYVYYNQANELVTDTTAGSGGSHGPQQEGIVIIREPEHPIVKGMPSQWKHTMDEIYDRLRGPAENMTVLATTFSGAVENSPPWSPEVPGTDRHEPMFMAIDYQKGRVLNISYGHSDLSWECIGLKTILERGAEWVATGEVTQPLPENFPTENEVSKIDWSK
ncbi:ThuA domain-containing protein [Jiulongibacter sediminis]|jgi:type 1 glutamine amidotransferase|uniref:ThuA domain-containing protein n=1 Tax=Jiulongibacter sediminis TaxID=1605367 RepID=UPI0026ECB089|nr:ThuA domain-containing protein [Jiulongibacter sediminis]